jgi:anti-sigma regulatory factor (Ser/Thr protein kinase)
VRCPGLIQQAASHSETTMAQPADNPEILPRPGWRYAALDLQPRPDAVPSARRRTRQILTDWDHAAIAEACELIVSELVTNAVTAARRAETLAGLAPVRLRLTDRSSGIQIEVWDADDRMPEPARDSAPDAEGGRGLMLVEALSVRWGTQATAGGGKTVWALVAGQVDAQLEAGVGLAREMT